MNDFFSTEIHLRVFIYTGLWNLLGLEIPESMNRQAYNARRAAVIAHFEAFINAINAEAAATDDNDVEMFEYDQQPADHAV